MKRLKIEEFLVALAILFASLPLTATPRPTPTPTPAPRKLGGGFGREAPDAVATPAVTAVAGDGQSLGQVVREAGRARKRKETRAPVSITNETLVTDPKKGRLTTASPPPTPQAAAPPPPGTEAGAVLPMSSEAEAYWRERAHTARVRVEELAERVRQFEQEAKKLESDFYSWDDGQYRDGVIKPAWDKKREELATAKQELEQSEKERAELPEKARKAGALPGWLRD